MFPLAQVLMSNMPRGLCPERDSRPGGALVTFTGEVRTLEEINTCPNCGGPLISRPAMPGFPSIGNTVFEWSCAACGVSGTVEAADTVDFVSEAIKAHHTLVSPDCPNSLHGFDVIA